MIKSAYRIAIGIITVFGLISIPLAIYQTTGNPKYSIVASVSILFIILAPLFLGWALRRPVFREFLIQQAPHVICSKSSHLVEVQENGTGKWTVSRTVVFLKTPTRKDLRDLLEMDRSFPLKDAYYFSPDSDEFGRERVREDRITIFWMPKEKIHPFEAYDHTYEWVAQTSHADPGNYKTTTVDLNVGHHKSIVRCPYPIEYAMAFKKPRWKRLRSEKDIYEYAFGCRNPGCPQPQMTNSHSFQWEIHDPEVGSKYFCVFFREGGVEYWKEQIEQGRKFSQLLALVKRSKRFSSVSVDNTYF